MKTTKKQYPANSSSSLHADGSAARPWHPWRHHGDGCPKVLGRQKYASIDATKVSIGGLAQAIRMYSMDHNGDIPMMPTA